ncbi:MAG TPA: hypothetical protein VN426_02275 [Syntrophomonadaceae bacterium]|nr:hypothetical protein [Syntrophomonadaceae bacterium]
MKGRNDVMTGKKDLILRRVLEFYVDSAEFNGIPHWQLHAEVGGEMQDVNSMLEELLIERKISLNFATNPHIRQFEDETPHAQLQALQNWQTKKICIYPSQTILSELPIDDYNNQPFTRMIRMGKPQLVPAFFDMAVLEPYYRDPEFLVQTSDFQGAILRTVPRRGEDETFLLSSFGLGYRQEGERVLTVYLRLLAQMPSKHQQYWFNHLLSGECKATPEYYQVTIAREKPEYHSIFEAFIEELYHINQMSLLMFGKKLFIRDFRDQRPDGFTTIFRPTHEAYCQFVQVLDQMMAANLNEEFFVDFKGPFSLSSDGNGGVDQVVGVMAGFSKWLKSGIRSHHMDDFELIYEPFKKIHSWQRQSAEEICTLEYGNEIFSWQNELTFECYNAVKMIRLLFANHPMIKDYEIPDWLLLGKVTIY